jgi:hypothetical protein
VTDPDFIQNMGKGFTGSFLEEFAESRGDHVSLVGGFFQAYLFGKIFKNITEYFIDPLRIMKVERILESYGGQ